MKSSGFVYAGKLTAEKLKNLVERLGSGLVYMVWTLNSFNLGLGAPSDWGDVGSVFNERCEIRWQRLENGEFLVSLLSDEPMDELPLSKVEGDWGVEEQLTHLFSLGDKRIAPAFGQYPVVNSAKAKLHCKVFYRDGMAMFVSPREVISDETKATS